jgi:hypothetical protein
MCSIVLRHIPKDLASFEQICSEFPNAPEGAAAVMILALLLYTENSQDGETALGLAVHPDQLTGGNKLSQRSLNLIKNQIKDKKYHMQSYFKNTSPEKGYTLVTAPYTLEFTTNPHSGRADDGFIKLFIKSSGADSPRPISVKIDQERKWKTAEWSSLLSGIRPPGATR